MGIVNMVGRMWTGFIWLRIGSSGRLLQTRLVDFRLPQNAANFVAGLGTVRFTRKALIQMDCRFESNQAGAHLFAQGDVTERSFLFYKCSMGLNV